MSARAITTASTKKRISTTRINKSVAELAAIAGNYQGRTLFATRFTPEDQVLTHLIFGNSLSVRIFTHSGAAPYSILVRSVDFFRSNIELLLHKTRVVPPKTIANATDPKHQYALNPATAPIAQVLQEHHLLISSKRKDQLLSSIDRPVPLEWDEANQQAIFYPLFDWTESQVQAYIEQYGIPYQSEAPQPTASNVHAQPPKWLNKVAIPRSEKHNQLAPV